MYEIFEKLLEENKVSAYRVSKETGVSTATITSWKQGKYTPKPEKLQKIADYFDVTLEYLCGKTKFKNEQAAIFDKVMNSKNFDAFAVPSQHLLPLIGRVCAGDGTFADDNIIDYLPADVKFSKDEHFFLKVVGDSMYPVIQEGDLVLVRKQRSVDSGSMAVVVVNEEEGMIKKVDYTDDTITLSSFNPYYPPRVFTGADVQNVYVVGLVVKSERYY